MSTLLRVTTEIEGDDLRDAARLLHERGAARLLLHERDATTALAGKLEALAAAIDAGQVGALAPPYEATALYLTAGSTMPVRKAGTYAVHVLDSGGQVVGSPLVKAVDAGDTITAPTIDVCAGGC